MNKPSSPLFLLLVLILLALGFGFAYGQDMPPSGVLGIDLVYATSPGGTSQLYAVSAQNGGTLLALSPPLGAVPSRWVHRRRTLGALETAMAADLSGVVFCPMGDAVGNGAVHMVDFRPGAGGASHLLPTGGNPASYDLVVSETLQLVITAEDDGAGNTVLRGWSYATAGTLTPLVPSSLTLAGSPAAHVTEMGVGGGGTTLHVPTTSGVHVVDLSASQPNMVAGPFVPTSPAVPMTNPQVFDRNGTETWVLGTSEFDAAGRPTAAGFVAWDLSGSSESGEFGIIPNLSPPRSYVPGAGTTELAVVGDGADTWAYYALRDPSPTASFIRPSAIGVVRFLGSASAVASTIPYPDEGGEPFAIPTVMGTRVAFESSQGPPFNFTPPGGGETISVLYTPLDPLGSGSQDGVLATPAPLGGRISTKGMDRPVWTRDGTRIVACTSHFPGAPNPGSPGIEVLNVPATVPLNFYTPAHYVVPNFVSPHRSIVFPSSFRPREAGPADFLDSFSFVGNVFHNGLASIMVLPFGEIGQFNVRSQPFVQSPDIPNFPAVHPPAFEDATASLEPVPGSFGARRTTFNLLPGAGFAGLYMAAALDDVVYLQPTGINFLVTFGALPAPGILDPIEVALPSGWITTTELVSL